MDSISRAALGSTASLGDLYDARRDDFCGLSIFKRAIPSSALKLNDSHFSDIRLVQSDSFSEKFSKMDVNAELRVSVLAGLLTLEGTGRYLSDKKVSAKAVKSSLIYSVKTKDEAVNIYHEALKDAFSIDAIESGVATHMVCGISWGATSVVSCSYENRENLDTKKVGDKLSGQLGKAVLSISGKAAVDVQEGDSLTNVKFDVKIFGDILPQNEELPTTIEGAVNLMKKMPSLISSCNDRKGKPITYKLIPIAILKDYLNFSIKAAYLLKSLEETSLCRIVQVFEQIAEAQQQLQDFYQDVVDFRSCVNNSDYETICNLRNEMAIKETSFRTELSTLLKNIRCGKADAKELESLLEKFQSSDLSPLKMPSILDKWSKLIDKIKFVKAMTQKGAKYIGYNMSLDDELLEYFEWKWIVMYFNKSGVVHDANKWRENTSLFIREMVKNENKYYLVDCDMHPMTRVKEGQNIVQVMKRGKVIIEDFLTKDVEGLETVKPPPSPKKIVNANDIFRWIPKHEISLYLSRLTPLNYEGHEANFICRCWHMGTYWIPGKFFIHGSFRAYFAADGVEHECDDYQVLYTPKDSVQWERWSGALPETAICIGSDKNLRCASFTGRANHGGKTVVGKVVNMLHFLCWQRTFLL